MSITHEVPGSVELRLLLTPAEAAESLALSRSTVYALMAGGRLRSVKVGNSRRIPVIALQEYVDFLLAEGA